MQLRPMADLPLVLSEAGAEWEVILREDLTRGIVEPHTTLSLAQVWGVKESTILPFLRWADGEQPLRHVTTPRCRRRSNGRGILLGPSKFPAPQLPNIAPTRPTKGPAWLRRASSCSSCTPR